MTTPSNVMTSEQVLKVNEYLVSNNQRFYAVLQSDGNFCIYYGSSPHNNPEFVWGAISNGQPASDKSVLCLQHADGNLVIYYGPNGTFLWDNDVTRGPDEYFAAMQDDGLFCEYVGIPPATGVQSTGTDGALWSTGADRLPGPATASAAVLGGLNVPWRELTLAALGNLDKLPDAPPYIGDAMSKIVEFFWASDDNNMWGRVASMIREAIGRELVKQLSDLGDGLKTDYTKYKLKCDSFNAALKSGGASSDLKGQMYAVFTDTLGQFDTNLPQFVDNDYPLETVTLMAVVATMHLYLYRDGILFGDSFDATEDDKAGWKANIRSYIGEYCDYVDRTVEDGLPPEPNAESDSDRLLQWIARNAYVRDMTINVRDARAAWPFLDPQVCPPGQTPPKLTREIYSDPFGIGPTPDVNLSAVPAASTTTLPPPTPNPPQLTAATIESGQAACVLPLLGDTTAIVGVTVAYDGVVAPRMGGTTKGDTVSQYEISAANPIVGVSVTVSDKDIIKEVYAGETALMALISGIMLVFKDGTTTGLLGEQKPYARTDLPYNHQIVPGLGSAQYPGHVLSSINVVGLGEGAGGVVFGFRLEDCWT
jgi:hypothetical protein